VEEYLLRDALEFRLDSLTIRALTDYPSPLALHCIGGLVIGGRHFGMERYLAPKRY